MSEESSEATEAVTQASRSTSRSRLANITDTSSSSAYVLSSNLSSDYQSVLSERDEVADDSDGDDNISLNVRQSFGPPSPIQRSGKKGVAVELDDYAVHGVVGRGKFSTVYLATRKVDGVKVALKKIKLGSKPKDRVREKCLKRSPFIANAAASKHHTVFGFIHSVP